MRKSERDIARASQLTTRRAAILGASMTLVAGALGKRMWQLGVEDAEQYQLLAEDNRIALRLMRPERGRIFDRAGKIVAGSEQTYRVAIIPEETRDIDRVLENLRILIRLSDEEVGRIRDQIARQRSYTQVTIKDRVSWEELTTVGVNLPALSGVQLEMGLSRIYPFGADFAHQVGYVGPVSDRDLEAAEVPSTLLRMPDYQIGKVGIERAFEEELQGSPGTRRVEVNASGRTMRELGLERSAAGGDLHLTLDHHLQNFMSVRLEGQSASAIVLDTVSGDLLGCASAPSFDPNLFVRGISNRDYGALLDSDYRPLFDKTVQGAYPPGSTIKMSNALAALEGGAMDPDEHVTCRGYVDISGRRFHCWKRGGHGRMNMVGALRESCDVYFYELAQRIGIDAIAEMNDRLGLGRRFDLPLFSMAQGNNPTRQWKRDRHGQDWLIGDTINASIGQGFTLASPMQLAVMTARLASGLELVPRMIAPTPGRPELAIAPPSLGFSPEHLAIVRRGMFDVCNHERGTAYGARIADTSNQMAGKTGTSQVFSITSAERAAGVRTQAELPWNRRDHALFVAFAPHDAPRFSVTVVVEHGGGGSTIAAPIARDIMLFALHGTLPPVESYPVAQRNRIKDALSRLSERLLPSHSTSGGLTRT
jgi:penicillin-binding protein 2